MKPLRFLGISLTAAAGLSMLATITAATISVWTPSELAYGVTNPMHICWGNMVITGFLAMSTFGIPGCLIMMTTDDQ